MRGRSAVTFEATPRLTLRVRRAAANGVQSPRRRWGIRDAERERHSATRGVLDSPHGGFDESLTSTDASIASNWVLCWMRRWSSAPQDMLDHYAVPPCSSSRRGRAAFGVRRCGGGAEVSSRRIRERERDLRCASGLPAYTASHSPLGFKGTVVERPIAQHGPQDAGEFAQERRRQSSSRAFWAMWSPQRSSGSVLERARKMVHADWTSKARAYVFALFGDFRPSGASTDLPSSPRRGPGDPK